MSSEAKACPKCGAPNKKKSGCRRLILYVGGGFIGLMIIGAIVGGDKKGGSSSSSSSSPAATASAGAPMPKAEHDFIAIVTKAQRGSSEAENDMARGGFLAVRSSSLKGLSLEATDWVGEVTNVDSNSDGKGVLSIEIAHGITVTTWNNSVSDISDNTLLKPGSELFNKAARLKKGQRVVFSGTFFSDQESGFEESSLTLQGKIEEPEFVFKFGAVKGL